MKKNIFYLWMLFLAWGMTGCEQQNVERYENDPRLYFFRGMDYDRVPVFSQGDSITQSFFLLPEDQQRDTVYVALETMGMFSDHARPFRLVQTNVGEPDAAIAGKHYVAFDSEEMQPQMKIPAGCVRYYLPLIVMRDPSVAEAKVRLKIAVEENDYFKIGIDARAKLMVTITAAAERPKNWSSSWSYIFGDWGAKKMWFLVNYVGVRDFNQVPEDYGYRKYLTAFAIQKLRDYNADEANPDRPLREADGTLVTF